MSLRNTLLIVLLAIAAAPSQADDEPTPLEQSLALDFWDESRFAKFEDGSPLTVDERREVERLVTRLADFDRRVYYASPTETVTSAQLIAAPQAFRGRPVRWVGEATEVRQPTREVEGLADVVPATVCIAHQDGQACHIMTRQLPKRWELFELEAEPIAVDGVFVKLVATEDGSLAPLIAAPHVEWLPVEWSPPAVNYGMSVLGVMGVDVAMLDTVVHRQSLVRGETAPFYKLLAATRNTTANQLVSWAERQLPRHRDTWQAAARGSDNSKRQLAGEVLRVAENDRYSVAPFFNMPTDQVGDLAVFDGLVRRALRVDVSNDPDALASGLDHYYELALFTDDSQNNPLMFCVLEVPDEMPLGDDIRQPVRIAGFFFKNWKYSSRKVGDSGKEQQRFAPLLIGHGPLRIVDTPEEPLWGWLAGLGFIGLICLLWLSAWLRSRRDREFATGTLARIREPVEFEHLDEAAVPSDE